MRLKLGVCGFLPTKHAKTNAKEMRLRSLRAVRHFMRAYLHAQTSVDALTYAPDKPWLFWLREKPEDPHFKTHASPCLDKNGVGSGISLVCLLKSHFICSLPTCQKATIQYDISRAALSDVQHLTHMSESRHSI